MNAKGLALVAVLAVGACLPGDDAFEVGELDQEVTCEECVSGCLQEFCAQNQNLCNYCQYEMGCYVYYAGVDPQQMCTDNCTFQGCGYDNPPTCTAAECPSPVMLPPGDFRVEVWAHNAAFGMPAPMTWIPMGHLVGVITRDGWPVAVFSMGGGAPTSNAPPPLTFYPENRPYDDGNPYSNVGSFAVTQEQAEGFYQGYTGSLGHWYMGGDSSMAMRRAMDAAGLDFMSLSVPGDIWLGYVGYLNDLVVPLALGDARVALGNAYLAATAWAEWETCFCAPTWVDWHNYARGVPDLLCLGSLALDWIGVNPFCSVFPDCNENGVCDRSEGETCENCQQDCGTCPPPPPPPPPPVCSPGASCGPHKVYDATCQCVCESQGPGFNFAPNSCIDECGYCDMCPAATWPPPECGPGPDGCGGTIEYTCQNPNFPYCVEGWCYECVGDDDCPGGEGCDGGECVACNPADPCNDPCADTVPSCCVYGPQPPACGCDACGNCDYGQSYCVDNCVAQWSCDGQTYYESGCCWGCDPNQLAACYYQGGWNWWCLDGCNGWVEIYAPGRSCPNWQGECQ